MPIDLERVVGAELPETTATWTHDDVILYHLGLGAGVPATSVGELQYSYEADLKVLPTYSVLPASATVIAMLRMEGMDVDLGKLLHGEQETEVHAPVPTRGEVRTRGRVTAVHDKGSAALVELEVVSTLDDTPLVTNRFGFFFRGEGGFGGEPGAKRTAPDIDGDPDGRITVPTFPQQALLYRLGGDKNPLHADPAFAAKAGFDRPILHGLCTYGMALKALVDEVLDGDVTAVKRFRTRFAGVLFPGETLELSWWSANERTIVATAQCVERREPVLVNIVLEHT